VDHLSTYGGSKDKWRSLPLLEVGDRFHDELSAAGEYFFLTAQFLHAEARGRRTLRCYRRFSGVEQLSTRHQTFIHRDSSATLDLRRATWNRYVLIVDEVLAVADAGFRRNASNHEGLRNSGRTVLFRTRQIWPPSKTFVRGGIWIDAGKIRMDGAAKGTLNRRVNIELVWSVSGVSGSKPSSAPDYRTGRYRRDSRFRSLVYRISAAAPIGSAPPTDRNLKPAHRQTQLM